MGVMKTIATFALWNPEFLGALTDTEISTMKRIYNSTWQRSTTRPPESPSHPNGSTRRGTHAKETMPGYFPGFFDDD